MKSSVTIVPYGSLQNSVAVPVATNREEPLAGARTLTEVIAAMGLPIDQVQTAMINHRAVSVDTVVEAGDRIALFPREYAFFVDWYAYRNIPKG